MKRLSSKLETTLLLFVGVLLFFPSILPAAHNCDFAAVMTKENYIVPDITDGLRHPRVTITYDSPEDYFYDFVISRSGAYPLNDDGYGVVYCKDGESRIPSSQTWFNENTYPDSPQEMDDAHFAIMQNYNNAAMVMSHDRNGSGGLRGNHPFTFSIDRVTTFAFMHNGYIIDNDDDPDKPNIKRALWNELYNNYGDQPGDWFREHPSNWLSFTETAYWDNFIDSELLFHWIMKNILEQNNRPFHGLHAALTGTVNLPGENYYNPIDLHDQFTQHVADNKINFVMFDGETLWVYRNTPINGSFYNLSYREFDGFIGIKTQGTVGTQMQQFSMLNVTRDDSPFEYVNFPFRHFSDMSIQMIDSPDPIIPGGQLNYQIMISNNGPHTASMVILQDAIPDIVQEPYYSTWFSQTSAPWSGSHIIYNFPANASTVINIWGTVSSNFYPRFITNSANVYMLSSYPGNDQDPSNNSVTVTTSVSLLSSSETPYK